MFKKKKPDYMRLQKFSSIFSTVDGEIHIGQNNNWANRDGLSCSVEKYLTKKIINDGYMQDENSVMYPIGNIISIKWELVEEKLFIENTDPYKGIFYNDEELEKLTPYILI